jgi:hypothetical protein
VPIMQEQDLLLKVERPARRMSKASRRPWAVAVLSR